MSKRVLIVQESLHQYRVPLFVGLRDQLDRRGVHLDVAHGLAVAEVGARKDEGSLDWSLPLRNRRLHLGGRAVVWQPVYGMAGDYDLVIVEQASRLLVNYPLITRQRRRTGSGQVALWGHGRTYTRRHTGPGEWLKRQLTRRGSWFFAYTRGGADHVVRTGYDPNRITVVENSVDTAEMAAVRIDQDLRSRVAEQLSVDPQWTCLFVGSLDESKRLPFLLQAGASIHSRLSGFRLVIAGDGPLRSSIEEAERRLPWLRYVGRADARRKVELASVTRAMLVPGRVGLVSVDAFVLGLPLVTTRWPWHAPEFEYVEHGVNGLVTPDDVEHYADGVADLLGDGARLDRLRAGCRAAAERYSIERMTDNFATGITAALA